MIKEGAIRSFRLFAGVLGLNERDVDWLLFSRFGMRYRNVRFLDFTTVFFDYAEFRGIGVREVLQATRGATARAAEEWRRTPGGTFSEKSRHFYEKSPYIYAVLEGYLLWKEIKKKENCLRILDFVGRNVAHGSVLEFGGGIGQQTLLMAANTRNRIVYMDVPGEAMDFSRWRFKKHGVSVEMVAAEIDAWPVPEESFDCIVSDAVLEHIERIELALTAMGRGVRKGGYLYLLIDRTQGPDFPMHVSAGFDLNRVFGPMGIKQIAPHIWHRS